VGFENLDSESSVDATPWTALHRYTAPVMKSILAMSVAVVVSMLTVGSGQPTQSGAGGALTIEQLIDIRHPSNPVWSPDGRTVAFLSERAGIANIFVADAEPAAGAGQGQAAARALTRFADGQSAPCFWSADGQRVYFPRQGDLWQVAVAGGEPSAVWTTPQPESSIVARALTPGDRHLPFFLVWFDGNLTPGGSYELQLVLDDPLAPGCDCTPLVGLTLRRDTHQTDARDGDRLQDVANPAVPRDALRLPPLLGTYQLTDTGDLGLDRSTEASLRKRIIRRVTTAASGFFHLPGYGAMPKLKGLLTVDAAERLQARIRAQVLQEPDVVDVRVVVSAVSGFPGVLSAAITALPVGGDPGGLVVPIQVP